MKFAQYLNDHAVPEWKAQYLDYKLGKKKLKKINHAPFLPSLTNTPLSSHNNNNTYKEAIPIAKLGRARTDSSFRAGHSHHYDHGSTTPQTGTDSVPNNRRSSLVSFQLPPPALQNSPMISHNNNGNKANSTQEQLNDETPLLTSSLAVSLSSTPPGKYTTGTTRTNNNNEQQPDDKNNIAPLLRRKSRLESFVKSSLGMSSTSQNEDNIHELSLYSEFSKNEFISWVDSELLKIESFYRERESHDVERFLILQNQLHQMREQRLLVKDRIKALMDNKTTDHLKLLHLNERSEELLSFKIADEIDHLKLSTQSKLAQFNRFELPSLPSLNWLTGKVQEKEYYDEGYYSEQEDEIVNAEDLRTSEDDDDESGVSYRVNSNTQSKSNNLHDPSFNRRDYSRKKKLDPSQSTYSVPYYMARRQLKTATLELYRSLELLKSYKILNRTAFRKMLKKFDKTTGSSLMVSYMDKIDQCYFTKSEVLDELIPKIEELYAFNFEKGNKKIAVAKLRSNEVVRTFYSPLFASGLLLGFSLPLFVLGLYKGVHDSIRGILPEGRYILQIWGGFFLITAMALLFAINCHIWTRYKVNYNFIFEFDNRTSLDLKQFLLIPSISMMLIGFFGWFSFENFWPTAFPGRYWPWFYVGIMLIMMFSPFNVFYYHSRKWILVSIWRLIFSGFYPVEFRDFFLGDIFCSLTYSISNISFFICLYANNWDGTLTGGETRCGSSSSRLMGFFSSLPSIWRFLQCIRRFLDTGDWFPHLANCLKYTISIIYYALLSVYRIDQATEHRAAFIVFASVNSIYSSIWDIFMDWSLMQAGSHHIFLRNDLIFKNPWFYYIAIIFDIIMRFQWIFYAFFARQIQQSAVTSFGIALAELLRRFVWIFFRMENEHCTNVHLFRASRDTPLPYPINRSMISRKFADYLNRIKPLQISTPMASLLDDEERTVGLRLRKASTIAGLSDPILTQRLQSEDRDDKGLIPAGLEKISKMLNSAHIKDFQRRKVKPLDNYPHKQDSDDDDEDEEENDTDEDEQAVVETIVNQEREGFSLRNNNNT